jgi:predicted RNA-binding protein YlqC (UPF0109 family)
LSWKKRSRHLNKVSECEEFVEYIVKSLVDDPDQVSVYEYEERSTIYLEVSVAGSDMGRVIGKGGVVVNSIRMLLQVLATRMGKRISLEIV